MNRALLSSLSLTDSSDSDNYMSLISSERSSNLDILSSPSHIVFLRRRRFFNFFIVVVKVLSLILLQEGPLYKEGDSPAVDGVTPVVWSDHLLHSIGDLIQA